MRIRFVVIAALISAIRGLVFAQDILEYKTSHPNDSFFAIGSEAEATVFAKGLAAQAKRTVELTVFDFTRTNQVEKLSGEIIADATGTGSLTFKLPTARYGIYYVCVTGGGFEFAKVGTAPKGFFTYGVLEDPAKMPDLDPWDAFLGEHAAKYDWLWQRGGLGSALEPSDTKLVIASLERVAGEGKIKTERFWTIRTNEAIQAEYRANLTDYVKKAIAAGPGRQKRRIYETLWEPNLRAPNMESIVAAQKVAWETIHALDPEALVGAYTSSGIDLRALRQLFEKGLGNYINAFTVHPYKGIPEMGGFVDDVRGMKRIIREYMGHDIPMFATESGMNEANTIDGERRKLCGQLRQAIILFGEGFQMYCPFYGCDFGADLNNQADGDYGLNYNLQYPKVRFGCQVHSPRPIFGALAAFARLTEGHRPTCAIEWYGETVLGYAYADKKDDDCGVAIWDWGARGTVIELPVGRETIEVADIMGNITTRQSPKGVLKLSLSDYPQYVLHVDPKIWGRDAQAKLKWGERKFLNANARAAVGIVGFEPTFKKHSFGVAVTLENRTDKAEAVTVESRIPGEPYCRKKKSVTVPPHRETKVELLFGDFRPSPMEIFETGVRVIPAAGGIVEMKKKFNYAAIPCSFSFADCNVKLTGDKKGLSFDVTVADSTPKNDKSGWWSWNGDSLQVALAKRYLEKRTQNDLSDAFDQAMSEYTIAKTPLGVEVCRTITWDPQRYPSDNGRGGIVPSDVVPRRVTHDGKSWHYVFTLPWSFVNLREPDAGTAFRLALQYNDRVPNDVALHQVEGFRFKFGAPKHFGWFVIGE